MNPVPAAPPLLPPHYQVERALGVGGQGTTYAARDMRTGNRVAIKVFTLNAVKQYKELELFRRECRVLATLNHPGIPRMVEECKSEDGSQAFLVMEYVDGETLKDVVAQGGPLGQGALWNVLYQGAQILEYLHTQRPPVVHRDIKPANLMQCHDGRLCLVDFGVVQNTAPADQGDRTWVGTYGFMAPEQYRGDAVPASDVYALGVSVLCLATGKRAEDLPHDGMRLRMEDFSDELPEALRNILLRMTAAEPSARPRDGADLLAQLATLHPVPQRKTSTTPITAADDDDNVGLTGFPPPVQLALGILFSLIGLLGFAGFTIARLVLLPLVMSIVRAASAPAKAERLLARQDELRGLLTDGAHNFRKLAHSGFSGARAGQQALEQQQLGHRQQRFEHQQRAQEERMRAKASRAASRLRR